MFAAPIGKKGKQRTDVFYWEAAMKLAQEFESVVVISGI